MGVDIDLVRRLTEVLDATRLTKIDISHGSRRIRIAREPRDAPKAAGHRPQAVASELDLVADPAPERPSLTVRSLHVGTAHLAGRIEEEPFAPVGRTVVAGDTLLLVEVMKVNIPILAPSSGVIVAVLIDDGAPVEFDQPMIALG